MIYEVHLVVPLDAGDVTHSGVLGLRFPCVVADECFLALGTVVAPWCLHGLRASFALPHLAPVGACNTIWLFLQVLHRRVSTRFRCGVQLTRPPLPIPVVLLTCTVFSVCRGMGKFVTERVAPFVRRFLVCCSVYHHRVISSTALKIIFIDFSSVVELQRAFVVPTQSEASAPIGCCNVYLVPGQDFIEAFGLFEATVHYFNQVLFQRAFRFLGNVRCVGRIRFVWFVWFVWFIGFVDADVDVVGVSGLNFFAGCRVLGRFLTYIEFSRGTT